MKLTIQYTILIICIVVCSPYLLFSDYPFLEGLTLLLTSLVLLWGISLVIKDTSIIDTFWGLGFILLTWYYFFNVVPIYTTRGLILSSMVTIWAVRMSLYIAVRNLGKRGEDFRYRQLRKLSGKHYWWVSFFKVFMLQGFLMWLVSCPLLISHTLGEQDALTFWDTIGVCLWLIGFLIESISDWQLSAFKRDKSNRNKVMNKGLWKYTRHPNYLGDAIIWWGYYMFALSADGYIYMFSPLLMTFILIKVSGAVLEEKLSRTKKEYTQYVQDTPIFIPKLCGQRHKNY